MRTFWWGEPCDPPSLSVGEQEDGMTYRNLPEKDLYVVFLLEKLTVAHSDIKQGASHVEHLLKDTKPIAADYCPKCSSAKKWAKKHYDLQKP